MLRKEWSLIVNSLMIQLAAGMFSFLAVYRLILSSISGSETATTLTGPGMALAGPVISIGMIASLFHLGNPFRAYRAVANIGTSWLSREIVFTGAFFVLWLVSYLMERSGTASTLIIFLTAGAGLLSVLCMAGIYYSTGKPGWFSPNTYTGFFGTIIILGSVSSMVMVVNGGHLGENVKGLLVISILLALLILVVRFIQQLKLFSMLKSGNQEWSINTLVSVTPLTTNLASLYISLTLWGGALSLSGVGLALYVLTTRKAEVGVFIMATGGLVLIGELLGRLGFYSLGVSEKRRSRSI